MTSRGCVICGKPVFASYWVCKRCHKQFRLSGKKQKNWPKWLKALVAIEQRNERHNNRFILVELTDEVLNRDYNYPKYSPNWRCASKTKSSKIKRLKLLPSNRKEYYEYIQSEKWKTLSGTFKKQAGNCCQHCGCDGKSNILDIHHVSYENFGNESYEDILVLCRDCHKKVHGVDKFTGY